MPLRRKKWTEEEEEALIAKYGDMLQSGSLSKMKSRERKFEPMAAHVNALYHARNPDAYPWQWTWKDASTKVQNMRHQYLGVKQKIRKILLSSTGDHHQEGEDYDWQEGLSHWSNFLKYKEVFGDQELDVNDFFPHPPPPLSNPRLLPPRLHHHHRPQTQEPRSPAYRQAVNNNHHSIHGLTKDFLNNNSIVIGNQPGSLLLSSVKDAATSNAAVVDQVVLDSEPADLTTGLGFGYDDTHGESDGNEHDVKDRNERYEQDDDDDQDDNGSTIDYNKRKRRRQWANFGAGNGSNPTEAWTLATINGFFTRILDRDDRRDKLMSEKEKEREKRLSRIELEILKLKQEWDKERKEQAEMWKQEMRRHDTERCERDLLEQHRREMDRARDEKVERERMEWREKMENQAMQHQAAMMQVQLQIAQSQQNTIAMLGTALLQLVGQGNDLAGGQGTAVAPVISQFLQNLQTNGTGMAQCGIRRGTGESSDSQFDVDG